MWKFSTFSEFAFYVLLLLALLPIVNSNETPTPRMCAVCLEKDCATGVRRIYPAGSDRAVWPNANSQTAIQNCSMESLKPGVPCKMANGSLVQQADNPLQFKGLDSYGERHVFKSQNSPCADLNLPPSSTPSPVIKAPIHDTSTPAAPNISVADNKGIIIGRVIGSVIGIVIGIVIGGVIGGISISIGIGIGIGGIGIGIGIGIGGIVIGIGIISITVLIWKLRNSGNGGGYRRPNGNAAELLNGKKLKIRI